MSGTRVLSTAVGVALLLAFAPAALAVDAGPAGEPSPAGGEMPAADPLEDRSAPGGEPSPSPPVGTGVDSDPGVSDVLPVTPNPYLEYGFAPGVGLPPEPPPPVMVGSGADALIRAPDLRGANAPTLLERYGAQGLSLGQDAPQPGDSGHPLDAVAAGLFGVATWLAQAVIAAFQWAFTVEVFGFLGDAVTTLVAALRALLYEPFVQAAVVLAGLSLVWHGLVRRRGTVAVQGMVWTVVALTAAAVFFARPAAVLDGANHFSTGLSRTVLAGVSVADPGPGLDDGVTTVPTYNGHPADAQLRIAGDRFWRVFIYQPWLVLQFGDPELGAPYGERVLASRTITAEERDAVAGEPEALAALVQTKRDESAALRQEVLADERVAAWFSGQRPVERAGVAMLALIGVIVGGVLLAFVAAAILLAQIALLLVVVLGPLALLVGIHPGVGRVYAVRWAELALGLLLRRVALGVLLAVVLVVSGVLLEASQPLGWFVVISLQALVVAAAVVYRKPFGRLFAPTTVPALEVGGVRRARRTLEAETIRRMEQWRGARAPSPGQRSAPRHGNHVRLPASEASTAGGAPVRRPHRRPNAVPAAAAPPVQAGTAPEVLVASHKPVPEHTRSAANGSAANGSAANGSAGNGSAGNGREPAAGDRTGPERGHGPPA